MKPSSYYYRCSPQWIDSLKPHLHDEILSLVGDLPKRHTQAEINADLFWLLTSKGWSYDTVLPGTGEAPPVDLNVEADLTERDKG